MNEYPEYPEYGQTTKSDESREDGITFERASNGALRGRAMWATDKLKLSIEHVVTRVQADTLMQFYRNHRALPVAVTWGGDGQTRAMMFMGPPQPSFLGNGLWRITSKMEEV